MTAFAIVLGIVYLIVGVTKLAGTKPMAAQFDEFGLGRRGMLAVGALEVAAAIGLQFSGLAVWAAAGMILMMLGALAQHRKVGHNAQAMAPALVVLVASIAFVVLAL